ncbi:MAG: hypothetical protein ACYTGW_07490 [Planctomycetota bacterium]
MRTTGFPTLCLLLPLACLAPSGCKYVGGDDELHVAAAQRAVDEQWRALRDMVEGFSWNIEAAGRRIAVKSDDLATKRLSVVYRMRATESLRQLLWFEQPAPALLDLWTLCVQSHLFFTEGDGTQVFGEHGSIAAEAAGEILEQAERYVATLFVEDDYEVARKEVYEFARAHPLKGSFARFVKQPSEVASAQKAGMFEWMPSMSLNPFGGVGKGIGEGAQAIRAFGKIADRFTDVVEFMPQRLGWQLELLQYDLAESKLLREATGSIADMNKSVEDAVQTGRDLPALVRVELEKALTNIDPQLREVQDTLVKVKEASATLDRTGATYDQTARSIEAMATKVDAALQTFEKIIAAFTKDPNVPVPEPTEDDHPYDIRDYDQTARSITAMAGQVQEALTTFQQLVADDRLGGRVADAGNETERVATSLIWTAALGVVSSFAAILVLLLIYRGLTRRRPQAQPNPEQLR